MGEINKFYFYSQKVLPLVYDDSLSYYEVLCKVSAKLNEVITEVNNITVDILEEANKYTDMQIAEFEKVLQKYIKEIEQTKEELNKKYSDFEKITNAQLQIFNNRLNNFDETIKNAIIGANAYTDMAIKNNNDYILSEVGAGFIDLKVINYFTGEAVSVQDMFDFLAMLHATNAISYEELAEVNKTYNNLIALSITYSDLAINGKNLIQ